MTRPPAMVGGGEPSAAESARGEPELGRDDGGTANRPIPVAPTINDAPLFPPMSGRRRSRPNGALIVLTTLAPHSSIAELPAEGDELPVPIDRHKLSTVLFRHYNPRAETGD